MSTEPRTAPTFDQEVDVAIVGTGFSGLSVAIALKNEGKRSFVLLEKADEIGGTWRENVYPGVACDVPSHLYSFSFFPNPRWSRAYAPGPEIQQYMLRVVAHYDLRRHVRFGARVERAAWDAARGKWTVRLASGATVTARHLVLGVGGLHRPQIPTLPGLDDFRGKVLHSATWDHGYDFAGKRIAVVGTGASAIQVVPQLGQKAGKLHVFQRTPPWILPRPDRAYSEREKRLFERFPLAMKAHRAGIYARFETFSWLFTAHPQVLKLAARAGRQHIAAQIADPRLRKLVTPDYMPGCKRVLTSNDYYPTLTQPNVELVPHAARRVTDGGVVGDDGLERPVDAIVFATGFKVAELLTDLEIVGRGGETLNQAWTARGVAAYLGAHVVGFPNMHIMSGPNTGLGSNSIIFMIEAETRYVMDTLRRMDAAGAQVAEVKPSAFAAFNAELQPRLAKTIWASGCKSWYLDDQGRNPVTWPGVTMEYWWRCRRMEPRNYDLTQVARDARTPVSRPLDWPATANRMAT